MNVLVIGGRLQGAEIAYLSTEAGWRVTLADRRADVLASGLCDEFACEDVSMWRPERFAQYDLVVPATENLETLQATAELCRLAGVPFAFDEAAYRLSSSKRASNGFLRHIGIPLPPSVEDAAFWRDGYIVKPNSASGSHGVKRFPDRDSARRFMADHDGWLCQAFVEGPIYSVEVTCDHDRVMPHCVTEVVVGGDYDCYRIVAPAEAPLIVHNWIRLVGHRVGLALGMQGIFDVELVWHDGEPFVLEIDARMPSQTPMAVYHAIGVNLIEELARCFVDAPAVNAAGPAGRAHGGAVLEHVCMQRQAFEGLSDEERATCTAEDLVERGLARYVGESELSGALPYRRENGLFGSDSALVTWDERREHLFATLVYVADSMPEHRMRHEGVVSI